MPSFPAPRPEPWASSFGEEDGPGVEPFLVAVATLSVLTAAAEENLVVCVVDDAHWLDPASAEALLFCARRLGADRAVMVFAAREDTEATFDPQGLPELVMTGLDRQSALALLEGHPVGALAGEVAERLVVETGGNPLALLELPGELSSDQLQGISALPTQLHLTAHVERSFLDRCRRLPEPVQTMVLLAAADDTGDRAILRRASATLGLGEDALERLSSPACSAPTARRCRCAIPWCGRRSTRRPRQRNGVASTRPWPTPSPATTDRETWHRAAAAEGPDDERGRGLGAASGHARCAAAATSRRCRRTNEQRP